MTLTTSIRRSCTIATVAFTLCLIPLVAQAVPITIVNANVWRADRTANPIGFLPTALVPWVDVITSSGNVADTHVTTTIEGTTYNLNRIPTGVLAGLYFAQITYDPSLDSAWTITATNGTDEETATRPAFVPVDAMPFLADISFTGIGTNIIVHWEVTPEGEARDDEQNLAIWDITNPLAPVTVQFFGLGAAARSVDLAPLPLVEGRLYAVEINSVDRNASTGYIDAFSGTWLNGWTPTEGGVQLPPSVPEPASLLLLATGVAGVGVARRRRRSEQRP